MPEHSAGSERNLTTPTKGTTMAVPVVRPGSAAADIEHPTALWIGIEDSHLKVSANNQIFAIYSPTAWVRASVDEN
jgi:hypothetical protein